MKGLIILSFKKILRTNQIILLFFILSYISLLYIELRIRDPESFVKNLNLIISYLSLLLTGGNLKDEISNGYLDIILHRTSKSKIVVAKFLSIFSFSIVFYLFLWLFITITPLLYGNTEGLKALFILSLKGLIATVYLISLGLFLSLYQKGYFNFAFVFFLEFASLGFMDIFGIDQLLTERNNIYTFFISLLIPHLIYSQMVKNSLVIVMVIISSILIILLTIHLFKRMEVKRG